MTEKQCTQGQAYPASTGSALHCGHDVRTIGGHVLPCGLPSGHKGHHLNLFDMLARCEMQIRRAVLHGEMAAKRGDVQDGWFADATLKHLRALKADIEAKIEKQNGELTGTASGAR